MKMYNYRIKTTRVIDGDTLVADIDLGFDITLKDKVIRLDGIDTLEIKSKVQMERELANTAKRRLEELTLGKDIVISSGSKGDKYGRVLAYLYTSDGVNINDLLVIECLAVRYAGKGKKAIAEDHKLNIEKWLGSYQ